MGKQKNKIIIIILIFLAIVGITCFLAFGIGFENIGKSIDKKMYGYSKQEIEDKLNNSELVYDSYELLKVEDKITLNKDDSFADSIFENAEDFTYYGRVIYSISDDTVKSVTFSPETFSINVVVREPIVEVEVDDNEINYTDKDLGLLSIRDLHLDEDQLNQVIDYGEDKLLQKLDDSENKAKAIELEKDIYESVYSSILGDVDGGSMFAINVEVE